MNDARASEATTGGPRFGVANKDYKYHLLILANASDPGSAHIPPFNVKLYIRRHWSGQRI